MFKYIKVIDILICIQALIISTMLPVYISVPSNFINLKIIDLPITWQVPTIILLSLIYRREIVFIAFIIYIFLGLFFLPIFHQGGSLGYLLTPNFGYLIGMYPLIVIINNLKKINLEIKIFTFFKNGIFGILMMHLVGMTYGCFQILYSKEFNTLLYNFSKYSFSKIGFHILMLIPISLILKQINYLKNQE